MHTVIEERRSRLRKEIRIARELLKTNIQKLDVSTYLNPDSRLSTALVKEILRHPGDVIIGVEGILGYFLDKDNRNYKKLRNLASAVKGYRIFRDLIPNK